MDDEKLTLKDIIALFAFLGVGFALLMMIGTCGAIDQEKMTTARAAKKIIGWLAVFAVSGITLAKLLHEEDE